MESRKYNESTSGEPVFLNVERFREEVTEVLQEEADSWADDTGSMKYNAEEYLEQYVEGIVDDAIESFNELVHRDDTSMSGNFADIRYDWEGFHNELPHGCTLKEVVEMIDAGEENEVTQEFKDWAVDWYFRAFGTYNLKYNWTDFISELAYNDDEEAKRLNDQED